jgi:dynein heavy chain, axonemal
MSAVLIEYELLYHRSWLKYGGLVVSGIKATLLVRHPETNEILINFDPEIAILIRETECMKRINLEISPEAEELVQRQDFYKNTYDRIRVFFIILIRYSNLILLIYSKEIIGRI